MVLRVATTFVHFRVYTHKIIAHLRGIMGIPECNFGGLHDTYFHGTNSKA